MVPPFLAKKHGYEPGAEPSDALLEDFALHFSLTVYHPTSTSGSATSSIRGCGCWG
jgi:choline dehydrogenase